MVDEIGGINAALTYAAGKGGLKPGEYDVNVLPRPQDAEPTTSTAPPATRTPRSRSSRRWS